jgi:hypothetical protein
VSRKRKKRTPAEDLAAEPFTEFGEMVFRAIAEEPDPEAFVVVRISGETLARWAQTAMRRKLERESN